MEKLRHKYYWRRLNLVGRVVYVVGYLLICGVGVALMSGWWLFPRLANSFGQTAFLGVAIFGIYLAFAHFCLDQWSIGD